MRTTYERKPSPEQNKHQNKTHMGEGGEKKKKAAPTASATATRWDPSHTETQHKRLHTRKRAHKHHSGKWK